MFPVISSSGAILNDTERCELQSNGIDIISNLAYNSVLEKFIAYRSMTLATHKLYVSYSSVDSKSEALSPSELVFEINRLYDDKVKSITPDSLRLIESRKTAFSALASESNKKSALGSALYEYFSNDCSQEELNKLQKMSKKEFKIKDSELATELFGKSMYISASKTEKFYLCPFSYFCEYGIKAQPRREAQMDPAQTGTLIHEVLEIFLKENPKDKFIKFTTEEIKEKVNKIIDNYVAEKLSGYENQPKSFWRTMMLLKERSLKLVMQLIDEFLNCEFVPVNFELSINNDGDIQPYLIDLDNGGTVKIIGKVDRVDTYSTPDNTFVRIVDYKTGGKIFDLGEVFAGLNMQMLIYLFAIWQNGEELYKNVTPAGIFYFQAKTSRATDTKGLNRHSDETIINKTLKDKFRMSGMVLNNIDVITAMEKNAEGMYIPAVINDDGSVSGNVISLKSIERLKNKVNELIREMANDLQSGVIRAFPTEKGCQYCKYHDVCRRDSDDPIREFDSLNFQDAVSMLGGDDDEQRVD